MLTWEFCVITKKSYSNSISGTLRNIYTDFYVV